MGGRAAIKLAVDYPNRVDELVVIGGGVIKAGSIFQPMPLEGSRNIAGYYKDSGPSVAKMRQLLESLVSNKSLITDDLVQERFEAANDPELIALAKHGVPGTEDLYFDLFKVKAKTLVVWAQLFMALSQLFPVLNCPETMRAQHGRISSCGVAPTAESLFDEVALKLSFLFASLRVFGSIAKTNA